MLTLAGRGALYTWDNGDGTVDANTTQQSKTLTYATKGTYNLTVTTANAVSSKTNTSVIIVQDELTGLTVTAPTAASGEPHTFQVRLRKTSFKNSPPRLQLSVNHTPSR